MPVQEVTLVRKEFRVSRVFVATLDPKVIRVVKVPREILDPKVLQDQQDQ